MLSKKDYLAEQELSALVKEFTKLNELYKNNLNGSDKLNDKLKIEMEEVNEKITKLEQDNKDLKTHSEKNNETIDALCKKATANKETNHIPTDIYTQFETKCDFTKLEDTKHERLELEYKDGVTFASAFESAANVYPSIRLPQVFLEPRDGNPFINSVPTVGTTGTSVNYVVEKDYNALATITTADATSGQRVIAVKNIAGFHAGQAIELGSENLVVATVAKHLSLIHI